MNEKESALLLADRVLDRPNADPDDDLAILARQLNRATERELLLRAAIKFAITNHCGNPEICEYWGSTEICEFLSDAIGYRDPDAEYDEDGRNLYSEWLKQRTASDSK